MKRLKLKESVKNVLVVTLLYGIIVFGVIALNTRMEQIQDTNNISQIGE